MFDLAGLTCGHYLIPFWTFFGATLIGKAIVKMHIQQLAVIIAFNEELLDKVIKLLAIVPYVGSKFQEPLKKYLIEQKKKLHDKTSMVRFSLNLLHEIYSRTHICVRIYNLFICLCIYSFISFLGWSDNNFLVV